MKELNQSELHSVSGGQFTELFGATVSMLVFGAIAGKIADNIPFLTPIGQTFLPKATCNATIAGVGGAVFGFTLGFALILAVELDNYFYPKAPASL